MRSTLARLWGLAYAIPWVISIWLSLSSIASAAILDVGTQTSTFSPDTRGFWFTAPVDFTITGVGVPTDASLANFDVAILRFPSPPPTFPSVTYTFDTLLLSRDNPGSDLLSTDIAIAAGDIIGVLGSRGGVNSYAASPYDSSILGNIVTLYRFGMQADLASWDPGAPGVWGDTDVDYFGRVWLDVTATSVPEPSSGYALVLASLFGIVAIRRRRLGNR